MTIKQNKRTDLTCAVELDAPAEFLEVFAEEVEGLHEFPHGPRHVQTGRLEHLHVHLHEASELGKLVDRR